MHITLEEVFEDASRAADRVRAVELYILRVNPKVLIGEAQHETIVWMRRAYRMRHRVRRLRRDMARLEKQIERMQKRIDVLEDGPCPR